MTAGAAPQNPRRVPEPSASQGLRGFGKPSGRSLFVAASLLVHAALGSWLGTIHVKKLHAASAIEIAEIRKPQKAPPPARVEPEAAKPEKARALARRPATPTPRAATPAPAAANSPLDALPDFGLSLSGAVGGTGLALPVAGARPAAPSKAAAPVKRSLNALATPALDACGEPAGKPRPKSVPQAVYPEQARAAGVEGKVRVQLTVDETGRVTDVRVLSGLGHGLDEAAVAAARRAEFEPALRCGKPVSATFTISVRFTAS